MKVSEFIALLQLRVNETPEAADYEVVVARDAEGNGYSLISDPPESFHFFQTFHDETDRGELVEDREPNAIVIWPS